MAVKLRLARYGAKKRPFYRVVAASTEAPRDGRFIEQLGTFDPRKDPGVLTIDWNRVDYWIGVGAQPTGTVKTLLKRNRPEATN